MKFAGQNFIETGIGIYISEDGKTLVIDVFASTNTDRSADDELIADGIYRCIQDPWALKYKHGIESIVFNCDEYRGYCYKKIQLNADSLSGLFKKRHLYDWMERGLVVAIGSDIHGRDNKAYKNFSLAKNKIKKYLESIKEESDKIFNGFI